MKVRKSFRTVEWVRKIRDKNNNKYKDLKLRDFADALSSEAKKSDFWKELKSRNEKVK